MQRKLGITLLACFMISVSWSQELMREIDKSVLSDLRGTRYAEPQNSNFFYLNLENLKSSISTSARSETLILLPLGHNKASYFKIKETQMMEEGLARKYPSIKTYQGTNLDGSLLVNLDLGPYGLHASIVGKDGDIYIEPVTNADLNHYYVYQGKDQTMDDGHIYSCGTKHEGSERVSVSQDQIAKIRSGNFDLLEYRLAIACTGEWGAVRGTKEKALADMVTTVNRLNQIFEIDLGIKVKLIDRNDEIIFLDPAMDPYFVANVGGTILPENTAIINNAIGLNNYDFGHVYTNNCTDVGGVAYLRSACSGNKGGGVSCFGSNLLGTTNRVVAHEMGHQFGANHTFHNCGENVSLGNDYEPGSGSTIMSYAGSCGSNNVASTSDGYYHNASLVEIYRYMRNPEANGHSCANPITTENSSPVITSITPNGYTLPKSTPFILRGTAVDANESDVLTYCWEQKDSGLVITPLGSPSGNAPLFRSYPPTDRRNYRTFPNAADLLLGVSTNTEVLPAYTRKMSFTFTVRDNNPEAGAAVWEYVKMDVTDQAGPFLITSPNNNTPITAGDKMSITWDVANTDKAPVNCKAVNIYLSIAGDLNPDNLIPVAIGTPNTGSAQITVPDTAVTSARFLIQAANNIFFDVSNVYFAIKPAEKQGYTFLSTANGRDFCLPATTGVHIETAPIGGYEGSLRFEFAQVPEGLEIQTFQDSIKAGEALDLEFFLSNQIESGVYQIMVMAISDELGDTTTNMLEYEVVSTNFVGLQPLSPENGTQNLAGLPIFTWSPAINATSYQLEVSTSPMFETLDVNVAVTDTSRASTKLLEKAEIYFWRVKSMNECGSSSYSPTQVFGTESLACKDFDAKDLPINITQSGKPIVESKILISDAFEIVDLNVKSISIDHDNFKDLKGTLTSPDGKIAVLFNSQCPRRMTLNFGFDNDAPSFFTCATTADVKYRPQETLDIFNGINSNGTWTLTVEDVTSGNGGSLKAFALELCGNIEVTRPLVSVNAIGVDYQKSVTIDQSSLEATNGGISPADLTFTVVSTPVYGQVTKSGQVLETGSTFTQADVNAGLIAYLNVGPVLAPGESIADHIELIVENNAKGWEGSFVLGFNVLNNTTSLFETSIGQLKIYPNPAENSVSIQLPELRTAQPIAFRIYGYDGSLIRQGKLQSAENNIEISGMLSGYYLIEATAENKKYVGRFVKI